ncbi:cytochrome P450 [Astrocystis sublimbata]|nr:cytochrome P450 [Astrocystis sublimbata]
MSILDQGVAVPALCILAAVYYVASTIYQWQRLRHIPGPRLASFSYLWLAYAGYSGRQNDLHKDLGDTYGPLVRIGPNELSTDDPETIRRISSAKSTYPRSAWYRGARFHPASDAMFCMTEPTRHDKYKAKTSHGYSGRETPGLESAVDEQVTNLISLIRRKYVHKPGSNTPVVPLDTSKAIALFTLDVISRIALAKEFGCLDADKDIHNFYGIVRNYLPLMNMLGDIPALRNVVFSRLGIRFIGPKSTDKSGLGLLMKLADDEVHKRYMEDAKSLTDILGSFRRHGLTEAECQVEALFMFVAGSETTSSTITIMLHYLIATPVAYNKVKKEIKDAIERGSVSNPITNAEARELPYYQALLYEGIRIRPAATASFGKEVPPEGDTINGHFVPGGTAVGPNLPSLMRSKALFGPDADIFRPERYLEVDAATRSEMQRNVELVFGYGRWMCAGKAVAWVELNKTLFELLRHFDFQILNPSAGTSSPNYGTWLDEDFFVNVTETDLFD